MQIDRNELIREVRKEMKLRKLISESLEKIFASNVKEATSQILQERELRKVLVGVIAEAGAEVVPHRSTGINVLEDLLKKIIPTIEQDYKKLTTSAEQRDAFKSHIVNAIQNSLAPLRAAEEAGEPVMDIDEDINVDLAAADDLGMEMPDELDAANIDADEEKFIDIDSDGVPDDVDSDIDAPQTGDMTGRNFAENTFNKIEKQIGEAYALLGDLEDKDVFYDYLITNIKLYFDKFEDELSRVLPEPTTPEYEKEKDELSSELGDGEEEATFGLDDPGALEDELEDLGEL
jgi:hypothetical protein